MNLGTPARRPVWWSVSEGQLTLSVGQDVDRRGGVFPPRYGLRLGPLYQPLSARSRVNNVLTEDLAQGRRQRWQTDRRAEGCHVGYPRGSAAGVGLVAVFVLPVQR